MTRVLPTLLISSILTVACSDAPEPPAPPPVDASDDGGFSFQALPSPAAPGVSALPNFATDPAGRIHLSWVESVEGVATLKHSALADGAWATPLRIASGEDWFVNWADFPAILALADGRMAAHWLEKEGEGTYAYGIRVVTSEDRGATWSGPVTPHTDGTETEHGFVSLYAAGDGGVGMVWLDGREMTGGGHGGHGGSTAGDGEPVGMTLRHAVLRDGALSDEVLLDGLACDCCQTDVAITDRGPLVVYRDRQPGEVRDIRRIIHADQGWGEDAPVHHDGWEIPGCPVNGPSAAAQGPSVVVSWFTAAEPAGPRVKLAFSEDGGETFAPPVEMAATPEPLGRVDVLHLGRDGDGAGALISWLVQDGRDGVLLAQRANETGLLGEPFEVARTTAARSSGFPRLVSMGERSALVAWTEVEGDGRDRRTTVEVGRLSW